MRIINFLWHFSTGGIGKCFLTYNKIGNVDNNLHVKSVCVLQDCSPCDYSPLTEQGIEVVHIKNNRDFSWMKRLIEIEKEEKPDAFFCHGVNLDVTKKLNKIIGKLWMYIYRRSFTKKVICVEKFTPQYCFKQA